LIKKDNAIQKRRVTKLERKVIHQLKIL